jgi:hypothetical protein
MSRLFDPEQIRKHLSPMYPEALKKVNEPFNSGYWSHAIGEVALAHFVGANADKDRNSVQLLTLGRSALRRNLVVPPNDASSECLFYASHGFLALGLGDWMATGERQSETLGTAHELYLRYFAVAFKRKNPGLEYGIFPVLRLACAAERLEAANAFIDEHLGTKPLTPSKARTIAELCRGLVSDSTPHEELGQRYLRAHVGRTLSGGRYLDCAEHFYLASITGVRGSPSDLLGSARSYVSHLPPPTMRAKATRFSQLPVVDAPRRIFPRPRPERILPSSAGRDKSNEWKETPEGWALYVRHGLSREEEALFDARAERIVEWSQFRGVRPTTGGVQRLERMPMLRRATVDAETLALLSQSANSLPLEVAYAPTVGQIWADARRLPSPPKLNRRIWKDTLEVGALEHLRALSVEGRETEKERIKRGDAPYLIVPLWFVSSPLARQLEALEVTAAPHDLSISLEIFDALPNLQELILWISYGRLDTACFWIRRGQPALLQSFAGFASREWRHVLETLLTDRALDRLKAADVVCVRPVDQNQAQEETQRYIPVRKLVTGVPLREL